MPTDFNLYPAQAAEAPAAAPIRYGVLLFPGFPMMAFSSVVEPLRAANGLSAAPRYRWLTVGLRNAPILASNGVQIMPDAEVRAGPAVDRIVVCSGGDADQIVAEDALVWIRRNLRAGAHLGAVADAAFFLARAGLLDGYACTLHWTSRSAFAEAFPDAALSRDLFVIDRTRFTAAGGVGCLDMMTRQIAADLGEEIATGVAEWFVHSPRRSAADAPEPGIREDLLLRAVALMEEAVEERSDIAGLCRRLGVSPDRLERLFKARLGQTPSAYLRRLRLKRAHDLIAHSSLPIREIGLACGYADLSAFSRAFRGAYRMAPTALRKLRDGARAAG